MPPLENEEKRPVLPLLIAVLLLILLVGLVFFLRDEAGQLSAAGFSGNYIGFLFLINGNIVLVMVFGFLVVKNVVKLFLDRNRALLGSKLRTRLVVAFVGLALVPTILLFLISRGIINSVFQYWFSPQVTASVDGALAIARYEYDSLEKHTRQRSETFAERLAGLLPMLIDAYGTVGGEAALTAEMAEGKALLTRLLEEKSRELGFAESSVYRPDGSLVGTFLDAAQLRPGAHLNPNRASFAAALTGRQIVRPERSHFGELVRSYVPITIDGGVRYVLVTSSAETKELGELLSQVLNAYEDYRELRTYRIPLTSTYLLALVVMSLLVLFAAIWVGFYLARTISGPIQLLAEGTQEVARGNLQHRIPDVGRDELRMLVDSFNQMTEDLQRTTGELVARRRYMETVLQSVGVGVMSLDLDERVTTCNRAAMEILSLNESPVGHTLAELGVPELSTALSTLHSGNPADSLLSTTISFVRSGRSRHLQITLTTLHAESSEGSVVLVDDLTELVRAQRTVAWEEVARRMAHEIKNPLTPIQLSAQRLERRLLSSTELSSENAALVGESTATISRAVETLRNLVNEFSRFARLPRASMGELPLRSLVEQVMNVFRESHPHIRFILNGPPGVPSVSGDREQMEALLTNLFENAAQSISRVRDSSFQPEVAVAIWFTESSVLVSVADNGIGVPDDDKPKLFEPYFSTRTGGTGLGLAIVNSIVTDHGGTIRVADNHPRGATFTFELPVYSASAARTVSAIPRAS